jgi:hypothetical protein
MKLHPTQTRAFRLIQNNPARFIIFCAGTGAGKSIFSPVVLAHWISQYPASKWLVLAPTFKMLYNATLPHLFNLFRGTDYQGTWLKGVGHYHLPDGGIIHTGSTDSAESIQGVQYRGIILDEGGLSSDEAWITIQQRVGFYKGKVFVSTTPYYPVGWLYEAVQRAKQGDPDYLLIKAKTIDNPFYPRDEYERARQTLPRYLFDMRYNGEFGRPENATYPDFGEENLRTIKFIPEANHLVIGMDFNNSPLHWVIGQNINNELRIFDEIYIPYEAKTTQALDELWRRYPYYKNYIFIGDASSKSEHTAATTSDYTQIINDKRFVDAGRQIKFPHANPGVINRVNSVNGLIKSASGMRRLFIDPTVQHLIKDIQLASNKEGTRIPDKKERDCHGCDALGYVCYMLFPIKLKISEVGSVGWISSPPCTIK